MVKCLSNKDKKNKNNSLRNSCWKDQVNINKKVGALCVQAKKDGDHSKWSCFVLKEFIKSAFCIYYVPLAF